MVHPWEIEISQETCNQHIGLLTLFPKLISPQLLVRTFINVEAVVKRLLYPAQ